MTGIVRSTLAEQAYTDLRARIVTGRLPAGQRLMPEDLASALAISPTPVKEALVRLERDGLVEVEARRGAMVRRFSRADVIELYEARRLIELHALTRGFADGAIGPAFAARLAAEQSGLLAQRALGTDDGLNQALGHDRAFHGVLVSLAANGIMAAWHERVLMQTHTVRVYSLATYPEDRLSAEHSAIVAACAAGDEAAARAALDRHLTLSFEELMSRLPPEVEPGVEPGGER